MPLNSTTISFQSPISLLSVFSCLLARSRYSASCRSRSVTTNFRTLSFFPSSAPSSSMAFFFLLFKKKNNFLGPDFLFFAALSKVCFSFFRDFPKKRCFVIRDSAKFGKDSERNWSRSNGGKFWQLRLWFNKPATVCETDWLLLMLSSVRFPETLCTTHLAQWHVLTTHREYINVSSEKLFYFLLKYYGIGKSKRDSPRINPLQEKRGPLDASPSDSSLLSKLWMYY